MSRAILILGAASPIARATAMELAKRGDRLYLAEPALDEVERLGADLSIRYDAEVHWGCFDADTPECHEAFLVTVLEKLGGLDGVFSAVGFMPPEEQVRTDVSSLQAVIGRNFTGVATILALCANVLEAQKRGFLAVITSVAGDRGRQSNYGYGAAKGGLTHFLEGLRNRLFPARVQVTTIKPGFVDTEMTWGLDGLFLVASAESVGRDIVKAIDKGVNTLYVPGFWRWIMLIILHVPETVFKRLKL